MSEQSKKENAQFLTFVLGGETFAFDVLKTREVLKLVKITPIPRTPIFMAGVINLRGSVVPVMDLRRKFSMPENEHTQDTSIIIVEVCYHEETIVLGTLVDAVKAVLRFEANQLEPPPKIGMQLNSELIEAIAKRDQDFIMILNVDKVFSESELILASDAASVPQEETV